MADEFNPKVSIVIPVYNGSNFMREAIDSALSQTYKNLEIVVVNDGSTDSTEEIAKSYGEKITYIKKENGGVATALNLGIKTAEGDYISWLSHDDTYYPTKIEVQINELNTLETEERENTVIFSYFDTYNTYEKKKSFAVPNLIDYLTQDPQYTYSMLDAFFSSKIGGCTLLIPKKVFKSVGFFDEKQLTIQDYVLWIKMFKAGVKFRYVDQVLVTSRHHKDQGVIALFPKHIEELNYLYKWAFDEFRGEFQRMPFWQFDQFLEIIRLRNLDKVYAYMISEWANKEEDKKKPFLWMYWENKSDCRTPDFIRLCWKTIIFNNRSDFQIKILTEDDVHRYLPNINPSLSLLHQIAYKTAYIRFCLLLLYGGIWLDSDFICFRSLKDVMTYVEEYGFVVTSYLHPASKPFPKISFLGSKPDNPICKEVISKMDRFIEEIVMKEKQPEWDEFSGWNLAEIMQEARFRFYSYPLQYFYPYKLFTIEKNSIEESPIRAMDLLQGESKFAFGQSLENSNRTDKFKTLSESEIIKSNNLVGDLFRLGILFLAVGQEQLSPMADYQKRLSLMEASCSWRITRPLRLIASFIRRSFSR